jgi:kumamolisin
MSSHVILSESHREHPAGSVLVGQPAPNEPIQITVVLRRRNPVSDCRSLDVHLSHAELTGNYGADPADIRAVEDFAAEQSFSVVNINASARTIVLSGPFAAMAAAFGADVDLRRLAGEVMRTQQGDLHIPICLQACVVAVLGFDQRPAARTDRMFHPRAAHPVYFTPPQVAKLYGFPTNNGAGQTIAMIELGGGFTNADLQSYWSSLNIGNVSVTAVSVDGAQNSPTGDPNSADAEVALDIEVAGGVAAGARIAVYFAPNTDQGFLDAINAAVHDSVRKPSVISISWGASENLWTGQAMNAFNAAFHDAALLGISVCAAAGDNGSSDGQTDSRNHVDFPASSPWVLACGGTKLVGPNGAIQSETVWNDAANGGATGGGVSSHFSRPAYQAKINLPKPSSTANRTGRGVPDVAGVADPNTGYAVIIDGQEGVVGGTSAVAPLWAALIALFNQELGKNVGWLHPKLYQTLAHKAMRDITSGNNGAYKASTGWDPCTGLGSPNGQAMLNLLKS